MKILLLGDVGVGKTSLIQNFIKDQNEIYPTVNIDFRIKVVDVDQNKKVKLTIWESSGDNKDFQHFNTFIFDACIIVYDVTSKTSFQNINNWKDIALSSTKLRYMSKSKSSYFDDGDSLIYIIGNKTDLLDEDQKNELDSEIKIFKEKHNDQNCLFLETSVKISHTVNNVFETVINHFVALQNAPNFQPESPKWSRRLTIDYPNGDNPFYFQKNQPGETSNCCLRNCSIQ